ncbi:hypothetical protein MMC34_000888 [Xylographa carneopallida]|nr:hypothetical protein [Xylographa carneopallida]
MYMTPAIAVAILTFAVSLHAQPLYYDDTAIIERSAQPIASADAYADAELEARNNHIGDFVQGAIAGAGANKVANHYGYGTTTGKAAVVGGVLNAAAHSEHLQHAGQRLSDAMHHLGRRDAEAVLYQLALQRRSRLRDAGYY